MREWRKTHPLTGLARKKSNARAYANVYQRRGFLKPLPCEDCGSTEQVWKHHEDYDQPLKVRWRCRPCRLHLHGCDGRL
jgi:hypothetical protein